MDPQLRKLLDAALLVKQSAQSRFINYYLPPDQDRAEAHAVEQALRNIADDLTDFRELGLPATAPQPPLDRRKWERQFIRALEVLLATCRETWHTAMAWRDKVKAASDEERPRILLDACNAKQGFDEKFQSGWNELWERGQSIDRSEKPESPAKTEARKLIPLDQAPEDEWEWFLWFHAYMTARERYYLPDGKNLEVPEMEKYQRLLWKYGNPIVDYFFHPDGTIAITRPDQLELEDIRAAGPSANGCPDIRLTKDGYRFSGRDYNLKGQAYKVLKAFVEAPGNRLTEKALQESAWKGYPATSLRHEISRLRRHLKIELRLDYNPIPTIGDKRGWKLIILAKNT